MTDWGALEYRVAGVSAVVGGKRPLDDEKVWKVFDKEVLLAINPFVGWMLSVELIPCVDRILLANSLSASKGPSSVSLENTIISVIATTLSASSRHRMVA